MKVKDIMTKDPVTCTPETTVAEAADLMWRADCGVLPVINKGQIAGVVTDRDMYIALATRDTHAGTLKVGAVVSGTPITCTPEDDARHALGLMRQARVRRLPVVGFGGTVLGVVSMTDIVRVAGPGHSVTGDDILETLKTICAHPPALPQVVAA